MASEAEEYVEEVKSTNDVKVVEVEDVENIKVEDSQPSPTADTTEAEKSKVDEVKNEEIEQVKASEPLDTEAVETVENPKETKPAILEPAIEADVNVVNQVEESNVIEVPKELIDALAADSIPNVDLQQNSEIGKEMTIPEAVFEDLKTAEEISPVEASGNVPEPVLIEARDEEVRTAIEESIPNEVESIPEEPKNIEVAAVIKSKGIEEKAPTEVSGNVLESAENDSVLLEAAAVISEKDVDIPLTPNTIKTDEASENIPELSLSETPAEETKDDVSKVEEIHENILEPSVTEEAEESTQTTDPSAAVEVQKDLPEASTLEAPTEEIQEAVVMSEEVEGSENVTVSKTDEKEEPEAVTEVVKTADEIAPVEVSENIPEPVLNEEPISEAAAEETETIEDSLPKVVTENIKEAVPEDVAVADAAEITEPKDIEEIAPVESAVNEPDLLEAVPKEPDAVDTAVTEIKVSEDIPSETTEDEKPVVDESSEKETVSENVPETAVIESPAEVLNVPGSATVVNEEPKAVEEMEEQKQENEVEAEETVKSETDNTDITAPVPEPVSDALEGAEKIEEKKENSLEGLLLQEKAVVAEEPTLTATTETVTDVEKVDDVKETKDADTALNEKSRDVDVDNMVSEKTEKDDENTKESNKKSSNIFTKMKHSIVKVRKAIIGKSPS